MRYLINLLNGIKSREPVATAELIRSFLAFAIIMDWIHLSVTQLASLMFFVGIVLAYWIRGQVVSTPTHLSVVDTALSLPPDSTRGELKDVLNTKKAVDAAVEAVERVSEEDTAPKSEE